MKTSRISEIQVALALRQVAEGITVGAKWHGKILIISGPTLRVRPTREYIAQQVAYHWGQVKFEYFNHMEIFPTSSIVRSYTRFTERIRTS